MSTFSVCGNHSLPVAADTPRDNLGPSYYPISYTTIDIDIDESNCILREAVSR
jgi:hypothetical protein